MPRALLYEVNTRCWLRQLSEQHGSPITLATVPEAELQRWQEIGFTHVWLMGVWTTGHAARQTALAIPELRHAYAKCLGAWSNDDVAGSPYAIGEYLVPTALGGEAALAQLREQLNHRGMRLIVDVVFNHFALDHPLVKSKPDLFVHDTQPRPETFAAETVKGTRWFAHGKDPHFAAWTDTVQLDISCERTRTALQATLKKIAGLADGVRCDMAMLLLRDVFENTWKGWNLGNDLSSSKDEFWTRAISKIRAEHPGFEFIAEAYWGIEQRMIEVGFDYVYAKEWYDAVMERDWARADKVFSGQLPAVAEHLVCFLENHDEERVAARLLLEDHAIALNRLISSPGMVLWHDGQMEGKRVKVPVQLNRYVPDTVDPQIIELYRNAVARWNANASIGSTHAK